MESTITRQMVQSPVKFPRSTLTRRRESVRLGYETNYHIFTDRQWNAKIIDVIDATQLNIFIFNMPKKSWSSWKSKAQPTIVSELRAVRRSRCPSEIRATNVLVFWFSMSHSDNDQLTSEGWGPKFNRGPQNYSWTLLQDQGPTPRLSPPKILLRISFSITNHAIWRTF